MVPNVEGLVVVAGVFIVYEANMTWQTARRQSEKLFKYDQNAATRESLCLLQP